MADRILPEICLFPTYCFYQGGLKCRIRGWVYCSKSGSGRRRQFLLGMGRSLVGLMGKSTAENAKTYDERAAPFVVKVVKNHEMIVSVGQANAKPSWHLPKQEHDPLLTTMVKTDHNGLFELLLDLSSLEFKEHVQIGVAAQDYPDSLETIVAPIIPRTGLSVISDVDDTIKDSSVYQGKYMAVMEALTGDLKQVPGMAPVYKQLEEKQLHFHYVSASPFQLIEILKSFMEKFEFPSGSLSLRVSSVEKSPQYKNQVITRLLQDFPEHKFVLVGDCGENDIEIYEKLRTENPGSIDHVFIRYIDALDKNLLLERAKTVSPDFDSFHLFADPKEILTSLDA
ncbi:hypothetical protein EDD86DRAFT_217826 [Gorgonomyces haynaldii]|nr:hypothetical protein EDD86DRAFT_217826 [Gorgonomyces haynaldii]